MTDVDVVSRTQKKLPPALCDAVPNSNTMNRDRNTGSWSCSTTPRGGSFGPTSDGSGAARAQPRSAPAAGSNRTSRRGSTSSLPSGPARRHLLSLRLGGMPDQMILDLTKLNLSDVETVANLRCTEITASISKAILGVTFHPSRGRAMTLGVGAQRRIRALVAMGYSVQALSELTGLSVPKLSTLPSDQVVPSEVWSVINDVYDQISMTPGPDEQVRNAAREQGWATPLAWDDDEIDDPRARPHSPRGIRGIDEAAVYRRLCGEWRLPLTLAEQAEIVSIALRRQWSTEHLADVLGIDLGSALKKKIRYRARMAVYAARSDGEREADVA